MMSGPDFLIGGNAMQILFSSSLREENDALKRDLKHWTWQCLEEARKRIIVESRLTEYQLLGSVEYLKKLVEADKK